MKKRPKVSFLRCYTWHMKEWSTNQISPLPRQKQCAHSLTFETLSLITLWLNCCDLLWLKLWSRCIWPSDFNVHWVHFPKGKTDVSTRSFTIISSGLTITECLIEKLNCQIPLIHSEIMMILHGMRSLCGEKKSVLQNVNNHIFTCCFLCHFVWNLAHFMIISELAFLY